MTDKPNKRGMREESKPEAQVEEGTTSLTSKPASQGFEVFEKAIGPVRRVIIPLKPQIPSGQPEVIQQVVPVGPVIIPPKPQIPSGPPEEIKPEPPPRKEQKDKLGGTS